MNSWPIPKPDAFISEKNSAYEDPMQVNITARHIKLTPAIAEYVSEEAGKGEAVFRPFDLGSGDPER